MSFGKHFFLLSLFIIILSAANLAWASSPTEVTASSRCTVCGMFVAKYPEWVTQVVHESGHVEFFDGVKDMMVYIFHPDQYGSKPNDTMTKIWVKDYYTLKFIDGKSAFYVVGSDVYGPMGHELVPFQSKKAASSFLKDHHGKEILSFDAISEKRVQELRSGHMMK